ncbi:MAG: thiamine pyrophosphate-binding protein, partial [Candidatus Omnitrophica bacterium]|nr:thiamine pyrophosphate-binding protein [Candidatus Omnitrophota bacterium]
MTGSEILIEGLKREGVKVIFGYPGGSILPLCDHLCDCGLRFILVRHEQGAAHAADGYARASGRVGVCLATSGPGATNLVTGIATAYMDSIPLVAITGQVATHLIGNDAFQEVDTTGITRSITKHNYLIKNVRDLGRIVIARKADGPDKGSWLFTAETVAIIGRMFLDAMHLPVNEATADTALPPPTFWAAPGVWVRFRVPEPLRIGDRLVVEAESVVFGGMALSRTPRGVVFTPFLLPGERAEIEIVG